MEGKMIGGCRIIRKIGEGGMGIVYEAEQVSLGRHVALKLLSSQPQAEDDYEKRFVREARSAADINHPNVVQVYNAGRDGDHLYLAMELVDGMTLQQKVSKSPILPPRETASIIRDICRALYAAEKKKIVHRDMKPANVMITSDGIIKVMDFGLAKRTDTMTHLTSPGKLLGTPFYMSPEQINGADLDSRSDIYSTGILLYYMLTRHRPFEGDLYTVIQKQLSAPRPDPGDINPDVPDFLRRLYYKMTKKKLADRIQSFKNVIAEIDKYLLSEKVSSEAKPLSYDPGTRMISREDALKKKKPAEMLPPKSPASMASKKVIFSGIAIITVIIMAVIFVLKRHPDEKPPVLFQAPVVKEQEEMPPQDIVQQKIPEEIRITGAEFIREDISTGEIYFKVTCDHCGSEGNVIQKLTRPESKSKRFTLSKCPQCEKKQLIIIENLK